MSRIVAGDEYSSAVRRLRINVTELRDLCEESLGLQRVAEENVNLLWSLFDAVSSGLQEVAQHSFDKAVKKAARRQQVRFDRTTDPIRQHSAHRYRNPTKGFDAWAKYRAQLRGEMDDLTIWVYALPLATHLFLIWLKSTETEIDKGASLDMHSRPLGYLWRRRRTGHGP